MCVGICVSVCEHFDTALQRGEEEGTRAKESKKEGNSGMSEEEGKRKKPRFVSCGYMGSHVLSER